MVEWKKLGEVCSFIRGKTITAKNAIAGNIPVIAGGQTPSYYHNEPNRTGESIVIAGSGAYAGFVSFWSQPIFVSDAFAVEPSEILIHKFLFQWLKMNQDKIYATQKGAGVPHVHGKDIANFIIPIPSLSEQNRIVGILDTFTDSIENLKKQIAQRRKQYEFYRDQLLDLEGKKGVEMKMIQNICKNICSGGTPPTSHKEYYEGTIPWLRTQEVDWKEILDTDIKITQEAVKHSSAKYIPANCVIVAMYGATAAKSAINKIALTTNQACCNLEIDADKALYKYVFHWLYKEYINIKSMGEGSQNNINGKKIKTYPIPLPSLSEQSRIVSILDTFEASISNLEAQLAQRQKQYEYYRNKLLSFGNGDGES